MYASQKCSLNGTSLSALHRVFPMFWQSIGYFLSLFPEHLITKNPPSLKNARRIFNQSSQILQLSKVQEIPFFLFVFFRFFLIKSQKLEENKTWKSFLTSCSRVWAHCSERFWSIWTSSNDALETDTLANPHANKYTAQIFKVCLSQEQGRLGNRATPTMFSLPEKLRLGLLISSHGLSDSDDINICPLQEHFPKLPLQL